MDELRKEQDPILPQSKPAVTHTLKGRPLLPVGEDPLLFSTG